VLGQRVAARRKEFLEGEIDTVLHGRVVVADETLQHVLDLDPYPGVDLNALPA